MPRGMNPNSRANLKKYGIEKDPRNDDLEARIEGKQRQASFNEAMRDVLTPARAKKIAEVVVKRAEQGNLKAYELIRDQIGEKPVDRLAVSEVDNEAIDGLKEAIAKRKNDGAVEG